MTDEGLQAASDRPPGVVPPGTTADPAKAEPELPGVGALEALRAENDALKARLTLLPAPGLMERLLAEHAELKRAVESLPGVGVMEGLRAENASLLSQLAASPSPGQLEGLRAENAELRRQLAKAPPVGPVKGAPICFRRGTETVCRAGTMVSDGFVDVVPTAKGPCFHAVIEYKSTGLSGEVDTQAGFQTNKPMSLEGAPDTWHLPSQCPFQHDQAVCPYPTKIEGTP